MVHFVEGGVILDSISRCTTVLVCAVVAGRHEDISPMVADGVFPFGTPCWPDGEGGSDYSVRCAERNCRYDLILDVA